MRPRVNFTKQEQRVKKKNHLHWSNHKHAILIKRMRNKVNVKRLQEQKCSHSELTDLKIDDVFAYLSINENINDKHVDDVDNAAFDIDFYNEYFVDVDKEDVTQDDEDENEEDSEEDENKEDSEEEEKIEEDLNEKQVKFGNEVFNMESSTIPIREYDDLVSNEIRDISVVLLMIKKKHKCTNNLLIDLLKLLTLLKVPNVPSSWHKLKQIIRRSNTKPKEKEKLIDVTLYFCPECNNESNDPKKCTDSNCSYSTNTLIAPHTFMIMNIQQQIQQVLRSIDQNDLHLPETKCRDSPKSMNDIQDGDVYRNILYSLKNEHQPKFISLTCNIDGVAVYTSSEQSMWTFTASINELKRTIRFSIENIIVLAVSVGRKKPSRVIMQKMLSPIVLRLKELQKPNLYQVSINSYEMLRVYLIGISNDKPANSLVQNQPEPNALYGCSKCEIAGYTTPAKIYATPATLKKITTTYVRIFPTRTDDRPQMRSNARWHEVSHALQNGHNFITNDNKMHSFGYIGECVFTNLAFVDRGTSFMSDTLHTIYHGAFKRLLKLWTESSKKQPWSIIDCLPLINLDLANIRYPSTTTRAPRNLTKCFKLKANESRVLLLIGYPIFRKYLPEVYFNHFKMLAFGTTIGESRNISSKHLNDMELLLSSFVDNFPYHERYIVQNIHSVKHFAITVNDFGPLFNYSTFNYESVIGYLSACIHGTKRLGSELMINLQLFKQAYFASKHHCSSSYLSQFIKYLDTKHNQYPKQRVSSVRISEDDLDLLYRSISKQCTIKSMKSIVSQHLSLSTENSSKSKTFSDSYVVYQYRNEIQYGIIQKIFYIEQRDFYLLKLRPLQNINYDTLKIGSQVYVNKHVIFGDLSKNEMHLISSKNVIEKACFYNSNETCYFARDPNFYESS
ncbi:unnamed protein product [Rotaria magnacalcarata]|uniref:Uncharacterized protein n=1 Tax=Rotaria magnacalcarata TaxID=392030 RepID=A0A817A056_9BILA|nr:unnamed protein product [Rotaria magnacalcarata]